MHSQVRHRHHGKVRGRRIPGVLYRRRPWIRRRVFIGDRRRFWFCRLGYGFRFRSWLRRRCGLGFRFELRLRLGLGGRLRQRFDPLFRCRFFLYGFVTVPFWLNFREYFWLRSLIRDFPLEYTEFLPVFFQKIRERPVLLFKALPYPLLFLLLPCLVVVLCTSYGAAQGQAEHNKSPDLNPGVGFLH